MRTSLALVPFADKHIEIWRQAVDNTAISPSPLGGPEYSATMIRGWGRTYLIQADNLLIPVAREKTTHFRLFNSDVFTGVAVNSLLGVDEMTDGVWAKIEQLPRRCVILLDIPDELYQPASNKWRALQFLPLERFSYHKIALPKSYEEWFARPGVGRSSIRRALREGLTTTFGGVELLESFYQVYLCSFSRWKDRNTASKPHDFVRFQRLLELPGSSVKIATVVHKQVVIAAAIFCHYRRTAGYLYGGINYDYQELKPNNLLHSEIIRHLIAEGVSEYNLGSSLNMKSLEHFKETLGAKRYGAVSLCRRRFPRLNRLLNKPVVFD